MSASYKEYCYQSAGLRSAHGYLLAGQLAMLGQPIGSILDLGYNVYGVDASESGIAIANAAAPGRYFVLDVSSGALPTVLAGKCFDVVISTEVIKHLYDPRGLIALARRILIRGGEFVVTTPCHGYLKNVALAIAGKLDGQLTALLDGGHIKFFSRETLGQMFREHRSEVTGFAGAGRVPWLWKRMLVKALAV